MQIPHPNVLLGSAGRRQGGEALAQSPPAYSRGQKHDSWPAYRRWNPTKSDLNGCAVRRGREHITSGTSSFLSACSSSAMATSFPVLTAGENQNQGSASEGRGKSAWRVESGDAGVGEVGQGLWEGGKVQSWVSRCQFSLRSNGCDAPLFVVPWSFLCTVFFFFYFVARDSQNPTLIQNKRVPVCSGF
jgi:hypothetical protein